MSNIARLTLQRTLDQMISEGKVTAYAIVVVTEDGQVHASDEPGPYDPDLFAEMVKTEIR